VTVTIPANGGWIDTRIQLKAREKLSITAKGSWTADGATFAGPAGYADQSADNFFNVQDLGVCPGCAETMTSDWGALISYAGPTPPLTGSYTSTEVASQTHFISLVGSRFSGTLLYAGELWLGFNDDAYSNNTSDNSGEVTATITVTRG
jgi:hypothetical protein